MYSGPGGQCDDNLRFPWIVVSVMWVNREKFATFMSERCARHVKVVHVTEPLIGRYEEGLRNGGGLAMGVLVPSVYMFIMCLKYVYWVVCLKYVYWHNCAEYV